MQNAFSSIPRTVLDYLWKIIPTRLHEVVEMSGKTGKHYDSSVYWQKTVDGNVDVTCFAQTETGLVRVSSVSLDGSRTSRQTAWTAVRHGRVFTDVTLLGDDCGRDPGRNTD